MLKNKIILYPKILLACTHLLMQNPMGDKHCLFLKLFFHLSSNSVYLNDKELHHNESQQICC